MVTEEAAKHPDKPVEVWATDEHRIGLKPILRRVWRPKASDRSRSATTVTSGCRHHLVQPYSGEVFSVCVERHLQAVLCRAAGAVCP